MLNPCDDFVDDGLVPFTTVGEADTIEPFRLNRSASKYSNFVIFPITTVLE